MQGGPLSARHLFQHAWVVQVSSCLVNVQYSVDESSFDLDGVIRARISRLPLRMKHTGPVRHASCLCLSLSNGRHLLGVLTFSLFINKLKVKILHIRDRKY
jgi:hypothetical protein